MNARESEGSGDRGGTGCGRVEPLLGQYADGELDPIRSRLVGEHLAGCRICQQTKAELELEIRELIELAIDAPELPPNFGARVVATIEREQSRVRRRVGSVAGWAAAVVLAVVLVFLAVTPKNPSPYGLKVATNPNPAPAFEKKQRAGRVIAASGAEALPGSSSVTSPADEIIPLPEGSVLTAAVDGSRRPDHRPPVLRVSSGPYDGDDDGTRALTDQTPSLSCCLPIAARVAESECEPVPLSTFQRAPRELPDAAPSGVRRGSLVLFRFDRGRQLLVGYRIASVLLRDPRQPGVSAPDFGDESPCPPDPDADGETDVEDIAYTLQIAHGLPASVPPGEAVAPVDPECEPQCAGT